MNALKKSLLAVAAVLAVAPASAFALPLQCWDTCEGICDDPCFLGTRLTTCGAAGYCFQPAQPSQENASVSSEQIQRADDTAPVCDADHPGTEQAES
ncbi:hypothetical protein D7X30_19075 [Corallococcus sp. AB011P]|uniref:hypothetical protein n=1 Tax=Corallococcus sp. AB011P TaxID=2316735 RepID=UPI000EA3EE54|nr:hypothetical protein [Corallococcus sp. AB011P]RKG57603.1 hypothetical protein D7X30_19075 [Corallococcus sp. AB011P]